MTNKTVWEKLELLRRHPGVHEGIINRFGMGNQTELSDGQFHEFSRHVEDCYRWFWPVGNQGG